MYDRTIFDDMTDEELENLKSPQGKSKLPKGMFKIGNKLMGVCSNCGNVIRIDKPIFGSLHFCI